MTTDLAETELKARLKALGLFAAASPHLYVGTRPNGQSRSGMAKT